METIDKIKMLDDIIAKFDQYFPAVQEHVEEIEFDENGVFLSELKCYMSDNTVWLFDADKKSIQRIMNNAISGYAEDEYRAEVSRRLQKWMWFHELTQTDLADATGLSQQCISNYISCHSTMSIYVAHKIASEIDCPAELFVF